MKNRNAFHHVLTIVTLLTLLLPTTLSSARGTVQPAASQASSSTASGPANSPWPMYQHDAQRTSRSPYVGPSQRYLKWHYSISPSSGSSPSIAPDGTIYVGGIDEQFHAIRPDGTPKWMYEVPSRIGGSPAIADDGTVYIGHEDYSTGSLMAFNPDGSLEWSYPARGVRSSPAIAPDGTIYVGASNARLYAINPDGSLKWEYQPGFKESYSSPAIGVDGTIYIAGCKERNIHAVNPDGTTKWTYPIGTTGDTISSPTIDGNGTIYIGGSDNKLYALNPDGTLKWSYPAGDLHNPQQSAAIGPSGTVYVITTEGILYAFIPAGDVKWTYPSGAGEIKTTPTVDANETIYFGARNGKVYAINPDGSEKWTFQTPADALGSTIAINSDGTLYVSGSEGVYAIGESGAPDTATIQGRVVDASTGDSLSGAVVAMGSYSTTTNLGGRFSLSVPYGDYQVSASHTGHIKSVKPLSVYGNMSILLELVPECASGPLKVSGWIPHFDYLNGRTSFTSNACRFEMINPVWYILSPTGEITSTDDVSDTVLLGAAENVKVVPVIKTADDSGDPVQDMLDGDWQAHANELIIIANQYDGIEIDYEQIHFAYEDKFADFVEYLGTEMPEDKQFIVTIPGQPFEYAEQAYDYARIREHADIVKIMAYDNNTSTLTTTVLTHHSALDWVEDVVEYATGSGGIPATNLILGVPTYGYRWGQESDKDYWFKVMDDNGNHVAATYEEAIALSEEKGVTPTRTTDASVGAIPYFTYTVGITTYLQYYEDATSTAKKLELASRTGLKGVSFWRLGGEDREMWPIISALNAQPSDSTVIDIQAGTASSGSWNVIHWLVDQISRLIITLSWGQGTASGKARVSETPHSASLDCTMTLEVYRPGSVLFGAFEVTEPIEAIIIDGAEPGTWESRVSTTCTEEQDYAIALSETTSTIYLPIVLKSH